MRYTLTNRLFDNFLNNFDYDYGYEEREEDYEVELNLAGVDKKNIDVSLKNTLEFQLRLEDRDGEWATHYDSLYYGRANIKSASPKYWRANPGFVTKNFNQQIPLSMHILDTKTLKTNWDPHYYKYYIQ